MGPVETSDARVVPVSGACVSTAPIWPLCIVGYAASCSSRGLIELSMTCTSASVRRSSNVMFAALLLEFDHLLLLLGIPYRG